MDWGRMSLSILILSLGSLEMNTPSLSRVRMPLGRVMSSLARLVMASSLPW